jgi:hypothetical protein
MRLVSCLVLVAALGLAGSASSQTISVAPATPAPVPALANALPSPAALPSETPVLDFSKILGAPAMGSLSSVPLPVWATCTLTQCKEPCRNSCLSAGCRTDCIDFNLCQCDCICK